MLSRLLLKFSQPYVLKNTNRYLFISPNLKSTNILNVNTNISKDKLLFKYENPRHFKLLNIFGITQFGVWIYMSHYVYTSLRDSPVNKSESASLPWWQRYNLGDSTFRKTLTTVCLLIGYVILAGSWLYTLRSVRFLVLHKGGQFISFVTYTPFGKNRIIRIPLSKTSAAESRRNAKVQLPIKVKGHSFYYMLDMKGEFVDEELFDATAGMYRKL